MESSKRERIAAAIRNFSLPAYHDIPDVGLYLEQVSRYISDYLSPLGISITNSMISNYVKKGLIVNPIKKQYCREQVAYLMFISAAKTVMSLEDINLLITMQKDSYSPEVAYTYFCQELENVLFFVFGLKDTLDEVGKDHTDEKTMLRNTIIAVAHKVYLDKYFSTFYEKS